VSRCGKAKRVHRFFLVPSQFLEAASFSSVIPRDPKNKPAITINTSSCNHNELSLNDPLSSLSRLEAGLDQQQHGFYLRAYRGPRQSQPYLDTLIRLSAVGYSEARAKGILSCPLSKLPGGLKVCNQHGQIFPATDEEAIGGISQRFRDLRCGPPKKRPMEKSYHHILSQQSPTPNKKKQQSSPAPTVVAAPANRNYVLHPPAMNKKLSQLLEACTHEFFKATDKQVLSRKIFFPTSEIFNCVAPTGLLCTSRPRPRPLPLFRKKIWNSIPGMFAQPIPPPMVLGRPITPSPLSLPPSAFGTAKMVVTPPQNKPTISIPHLSPQQQQILALLAPGANEELPPYYITTNGVKEEMIGTMRSEMERLCQVVRTQGKTLIVG
jgi:hypothetical protein